MLSDVTFGQYFPSRSIIHKMDARLKVVLTIFFIVLTFCSKNFVNIALVYAVIIFAMAKSTVPAKTYIKSLKPILFIVTFTAVLNVFYGTGEPIFQFWVFKITKGGLLNAGLIALRIVALIFVSSVLTFTTSATELTDALERLLKPLTKIKVPVHEFAMMMTIALRFVPTLLEETDKIMSAQKARGADMESGGIIDRIKALIPILIPLFVSAFRRAYDLATAMESRCYTGGDGRTKMKVLKMGKIDYITIGVLSVFTVVFTVLNILLPQIVR